MRLLRQFVDNLAGTALQNCQMLGTGKPPGVPGHVEFSIPYLGDCWLMQSEAAMGLKVWAYVCGLSGILGNEREKLLQREISMEKGLLYHHEMSWACDHWYFPLLAVPLPFVCVQTFADIPLVTFLVMLTLPSCLLPSLWDAFVCVDSWHSVLWKVPR